MFLHGITRVTRVVTDNGNCSRSSTLWVKSAVPQLRSCPRTAPTGSLRSSRTGARRRVRCADPFRVVAWATDALDEVRRAAWNTARGAVNQRRAGRASGLAKALKGARYAAVWKNPGNLTDKRQAKLAWVAKTDLSLYRGHLLKEGLRLVLQLAYAEAVEALDLDRVGPTLPLPRVRGAVTPDRETPRLDPRRDRTRPVQWSRRVGQHQDPLDHPDRVRVPLTTGPYRPGHAQPQRPPVGGHRG